MMKKLFLLFTVILLPAAGFAQGAVKPGFVKIRYVSPYADTFYADEIIPGQLGVSDGAERVFHFAEIGGGRYLVAVDYENTDGYGRGRFLFNDLTEGDAYGHAVFAEAVFSGDTLYVTNDLLEADLSELDVLVQGENVEKIALKKINRFAFTFSPVTEEGFPEESYTIESEIGGQASVNTNTGVLTFVARTVSWPDAFLFESATEPIPENIYYLPAEGTYSFRNSRELRLAENPEEGGIFLLGLLPSAEIPPSAGVVFYLEWIGGGQYVVVSGHEKTDGYLRGRFLFDATDLAWGDGPGSTFLDQAYILNGRWTRLAFAEAIRMNGVLYVLDGEPVEDVSRLEELAQAGRVRKMELTAASRFTFAFLPTVPGADDFYIQTDRVNASTGSWIRIQTGIPVISAGTSDDAEPFSLEAAADPIGSGTVEASRIVYGDGLLTVDTPAAEQIEVYSAGGQLLYRARKTSGPATFDLNGLPGGLLVIRGSSGWVKKAVKQERPVR
ncbi:MAG: hypothetical protein LBJ01_06225 [Tannerella sp.]|jgi:hypothetical protein|nr:hypothetical protein [Tannerella sp.]